MSPVDLERSEVHRYFQAIEETFVRLRGAPLLLSPADWRTASAWHRQGIPLEVVQKAMEEVFERRRERGSKGRVGGLRYCSAAVRSAWETIQELNAANARAAGREMDPAKRLAALAAALPAALPDREVWAKEILDLEGADEQIEAALADIDRRLIESLEKRQDEASRRALDRSLEASLQPLSGRLVAEELTQARRRLARQLLRQRAELPLLSLFSPEARAADQSLEPAEE